MSNQPAQTNSGMPRQADYEANPDSVSEYLAQRTVNSHQFKADAAKLYRMSLLGKSCSNCNRHNNLTDFCRILAKKTVPDNICVNHNRQPAG